MQTRDPPREVFGSNANYPNGTRTRGEEGKPINFPKETGVAPPLANKTGKNCYRFSSVVYGSSVAIIGRATICVTNYMKLIRFAQS